MYEPRVNPIKIISPISGTTCMPKITEKKIGDKIYVEATWYDHASGEFLRRGIVKVLNAANRKEILAEGQGVTRYPEFNKLQTAIRHAYKLNNIKLTLKLQDELRNWADSKGIDTTANADVWELLTLNDNEATFTSDDDKKARAGSPHKNNRVDPGMLEDYI